MTERMAFPAAPIPQELIDAWTMMLVMTVLGPFVLALAIMAFQLFPFGALGYGLYRLFGRRSASQER